MAEILQTTLATSQPLSICTGFPLFPLHPGTDANPTLSTSQMHGIPYQTTLINVQSGVPIIDLVIVGVEIGVHLKINFCFYMGFCGPTLACSTSVQGETFDGGTAVTNFSNSSVLAGFGLGAALQFDFIFDVGLSVFYDILIDSGTFQIFGITFTITIQVDLIQTMIGLIEKYLASRNQAPSSPPAAPAPSPEPSPSGSPPGGLGGLASNLSASTSLTLGNIPVPDGFWSAITLCQGFTGSVWGFQQAASDGDGIGVMDGGILLLDPTITITLNLAPYIPIVQDVASLVSDIGGTLTLGPQVTIGFPITLTVHALITDNDRYYGPDLLSANSGTYQDQLAEAAIAAYNAQGWYIPLLPDLLSLAGDAVELNVYPDTTQYFAAIITAAGGTVPAPPGDNLVGNAIGFSAGPAKAAYSINMVNVQFLQNIGISVELGLTFGINVLGINASATIPIAGTSGSGAPIDIGNVFGSLFPNSVDQLTNTNGAQYVSAASSLAGRAARLQGELVDIVFETTVVS